MQNKVYAVIRKIDGEQWWTVIDCGVTAKGGWSTNSNAYFTKDGRTYRWHERLHLFLNQKVKEWQEISIVERTVCILAENGYYFEGWKDSEEDMYQTFVNFAKAIGKEMTIQEVKELITIHQK